MEVVRANKLSLLHNRVHYERLPTPVMLPVVLVMMMMHVMTVITIIIIIIIAIAVIIPATPAARDGCQLLVSELDFGLSLNRCVHRKCSFPNCKRFQSIDTQQVEYLSSVYIAK